MKTPTTVARTIAVNATPEEAFAVVADLPRMGEWSLECTGVRWKKGATRAENGVKFRGYNRRGTRRWSTSGEIVRFEPGRVLAWNVSFLGLPMSTWSYEFSATDFGCTITERWVDRQLALTRPGLVGWLVTGTWRRKARNDETMRHTLERIKASIEMDQLTRPRRAARP